MELAPEHGDNSRATNPAKLLQSILDMLGNGCLMDPNAGGDFALGIASKVVEGQAFILPGGERLNHRFSHLAHLRTNEARMLLLRSLLVAVVSGPGGGDDGRKNGGITANLFKTVVKPGHFS